MFPEAVVDGARGSLRDAASAGRSATSARRLRRFWKSPLWCVGSWRVGCVVSVYGGAGWAIDVMEWGLPESWIPSRCRMAPMELRSSERVSRLNLVVVVTMDEARDLRDTAAVSSVGSSSVLELVIENHVVAV